MSRIGKRPIVPPSGVKIQLEGNVLRVEGPKGKLSMEIAKSGDVEVSIADGTCQVKRKNDSREARREQGLVRALAANMVVGVTKGFSKDLDIVGVGYKAELKGNVLNLNLGYSHPIEFQIPKGIQIAMEKLTHITVSGADKCQVGEVAAHLRRLRPPEPYKGKGVKYTAEHIKRKVGKAAVGTGIAKGG